MVTPIPVPPPLMLAPQNRQRPLYLIRFSQTHLSFRLAEIAALERLFNSRQPSQTLLTLLGKSRPALFDGTEATKPVKGVPRLWIEIEVVRYEDESPFCLVRLRLFVRGGELRVGGGKCDQEVDASEEVLAQVAREIIGRSVQARGIYEVWGVAGLDDVGQGDMSKKISDCMDANGKSNGKHDIASENASNGPISTLPTHKAAALHQTGSTSMPDLPPFSGVHPLYPQLHESTTAISSHRWAQYRGTQATDLKFKFLVDTFNHSRTTSEQRDIINSFAYLDFGGLVRMKDANQVWVVFEEWVGPCSAAIAMNGDAAPTEADEDTTFDNAHRDLRRLFIGRELETRTLRPLKDKHDLKKRPYISTTSMDAELALVTANLALAGPGKIFLDPFCGTGGFLIAAAELGAWVLGSDIDGRSFRGKSGRGVEGGVGKNLRKYALEACFGGCLTSDLVNTPLRIGGGRRRWLDGIICDPPYGVREGLKVLGARNAPLAADSQEPRTPHLIDGVPAHTLPGYVVPKKPYSFEKMLDDVLDFAARTLVDGARLAFWMPSANENELGEEVETSIPQHQALELKHVCVQRFNRWSRRLLVYERRHGEVEDLLINAVGSDIAKLDIVSSTTADELNHFRKRYFQAFAVNGKHDTA